MPAIDCVAFKGGETLEWPRRRTRPESAPEGAPSPTLGTVVYARRPDGSVLLVHRRRPPFAGHWVGPCGSIDGTESPAASAQREFHEATGLNALDLRLKGIIREVSPHEELNRLLFLYRCCAGGRHCQVDHEEDTRWWTRHELDHAPVPEAERWWLPHVLGDDRHPLEATVHYDAELAMTGIEQGPS